MNRKIFLTAMLIPALTILAFIGYNYYTLHFGEEVLLKTAPIDPRDLFRGDYVRLNYEISTINLSNIPHDGSFTPGEDVYAVLGEGDRYWFVKRVEHKKPELKNGDVCVKGRVTTSFNNLLRVTWGIESYFVPEGKGRSIEREIRNVSVKASVDPTCRAVIKELLINDEPVEFEG